MINRKNQSGAVLAVSLIMLVVLTLLGVTAMQSTTMEERMAGNLRDRNLAFQASEGALVLAEGWLSNLSDLPLDKSDGSGGIWTFNNMDPDANNGLPWWEEQSTDAAWWATNGGDGNTVVAMGTSLSSQPTYIIEKFPLTVGPSMRSGAALQSENMLRVTARGVGGSESAVVILQTMYKW